MSYSLLTSARHVRSLSLRSLAHGSWVALAGKRNDEALQLMRAAADAEEASDKHPVTPGNAVPSRQLLGEMLLAVG
jgi:hypothetical protein